MTCTLIPLTDISGLMSWRSEVIRAVFGINPSPELLEANRKYYEAHIADGSHIAVVAALGKAETGCGAICLTDELPSPDNPSGRCAYLMNIYVRPQYRSQGIGHEIVKHLVKTARQLGCDKIYLETTAQARSLYSSIGFTELPGILKYADIRSTKS